MTVIVTNDAQLGTARAAVDQVVRDIDDTCSRFRDDSELSRFNARSGTDVQVSPLLAAALQAALRGAQLSDGAVDPTVGSAVRNAGYSVDFIDLPTDGGPLTLVARPVPGWQRIRFHAATRRACIPRGVEIDLGSTAKALAADLAAAAAVTAMQTGGVLVNLGGDISVAGEPPDSGWHIQLAEDSGSALTNHAETISIRAGGVATSSTTVRRWTRGGITLHHIIDPATGLPAAGPWRTATVSAGNCLDANIAATAAIVRGEQAMSWLRSAGLSARLVDHQGRITYVNGWPDAQGA